jgi:hypothetical protein
MTSVVNIASGAGVAPAKETYHGDLWAFHRQKLHVLPGAAAELRRADERDRMQALFDITNALQSGLPTAELFFGHFGAAQTGYQPRIWFAQSLGQRHRKAPYRGCGFTSRAGPHAEVHDRPPVSLIQKRKNQFTTTRRKL